MSSYFIFALVLTGLYIVYYAVNITRDLYGKKGTEKTDEEVFDLGPMDAKAEAQMEEIAPYLSDGFTDEEMYKALISKGRLDNRPCLKWRPVKDKL